MWFWIWVALGVVGFLFAVMMAFACFQWAHEARIRRDGREARGWIVSAPPDMYEKGCSGSAVFVVFTFEGGGSTMNLSQWVEDVKAYRAPPNASKDEKWMEECMRTGFATSKFVRLPQEIAGGVEGYFTSVFVEPDMLPGGKIMLPYVVIRAVLGDNGGTMMVKYEDSRGAK